MGAIIVPPLSSRTVVYWALWIVVLTASPQLAKVAADPYYYQGKLKAGWGYQIIVAMAAVQKDIQVNKLLA